MNQLAKLSSRPQTPLGSYYCQNQPALALERKSRIPVLACQAAPVDRDAMGLLLEREDAMHIGEGVRRGGHMLYFILCYVMLFYSLRVLYALPVRYCVLYAPLVVSSC